MVQLPLFDTTQTNNRARKSGNVPSVRAAAPNLQTKAIIQKVLEVLGTIDQDVNAGILDTPANVRFTLADNPLQQHWEGRVWVNLPPGHSTARWVKKLQHDYEFGGVTSALAMLPARMNTVWWATIANYPLCAISSRIEVLKPNGTKSRLANAAVIIYMGPQLTRFATAFNKLGPIYIPYEG